MSVPSLLTAEEKRELVYAYVAAPMAVRITFWVSMG